MFGVRTSHRSARKPVNGEKRASLREALRNRGGAQAAAIVTPAQTDIEDEVDVDMGGDKSAGLDWLNLTAFAPKNLQAVIEKLRADNLPAVVRGQSDNETGKVSSSRPGRADYYSSDGEDSGLDTGRPSLRLSGVLTPKSAAANSSKRKSGIRAALQARGGMQRASVGSAMAATDSDADIPEASAATFELPDQSSAFDGGLPASPSQSPLASSPLPSVTEEEVEAADPEAVGAGVFVEPPNGLAADSASAQELPAQEAAAEPAAAQEEEQEPAEEASPPAAQEEAAPAPAETVADSEPVQESEAKEDEAASEPEVQEEPPEAPTVPEAEAVPEAPEEPEAPPTQEEPATAAPAGSPQQVADAPVADEAKAVDGDASASPAEAAAPPQEAPQAEVPEGEAKEEDAASIQEKPGDPPPQEPATELAEVATAENPAEKPAEKPASPQEPEPAKAEPAKEAKPAAVAEAEKPKLAPAPAPAEPAAASSAPQAETAAKPKPAAEAAGAEAPKAKAASEPVKAFAKVETITKPEKIQRASTDYKLQHFNKPLPKLPGEDGNPVVPAWKNVKLNNRRHTLSTLKEDEVTSGPDKLSIKDLKQFWGNKNAKGFAGPAIGATSRLSKNEAQATLQRLIAAGGAVDFDEVRRLRKMIAELD